MQRPEAQPPSVRAAVGTGALAVLLTTVLGGIWSGLVIANLATTPALPWAAIAMAAILGAPPAAPSELDVDRGVRMGPRRRHVVRDRPDGWLDRPGADRQSAAPRPARLLDGS